MEAKRFSRDTIDQDQLQAEYTVNPDTEEEEGGGGEAEKEKKKKAGPQLPLGRPRGTSGSIGCQAERCGADLSDAKKYHRRHKVCEVHSKAPVVIVAGLRQRFCQQCSRFHELSEFDEAKRSCRRRLAGHNERRRKNSIECCGESSSNSKTMSKDHNIYNNIRSDGSDHLDQRPKFHMMTPQGNSTACKQFHIR